MIRNIKLIIFVIIFFLLSILYNTVTLEGFDMRKELNDVQIEAKANEKKITTIVFSSIFGALFLGVALMALSNPLKIDDKYKSSDIDVSSVIMDTIRKYVPGFNK